MTMSVDHLELPVCEAWMLASDVVALHDEHGGELPESNFLKHMLKAAKERLKKGATCPKCKAPNDVDASFCKKCAASMQVDLAAEAMRVPIDDEHFWWSGAGSDNTDLFKTLAGKIHGRMDVIFHWDGYDPTAFRIEDGRVVECEIVMTLRPVEEG